MNRVAVLVITGAIAITVGTAKAQTDPKAERAAFAAEIPKLLAEKDSRGRGRSRRQGGTRRQAAPRKPRLWSRAT